MSELHYERLDVYRLAIRFLGVCDRLSDEFAKPRRHMAEQLRRAASSVALNIAEGAGEFSPAEKARFYRFALRSTTECATVLHRLVEIGCLSRVQARDARDLSVRLFAMITGMVLSVERRLAPEERASARSPHQRRDNGRERERERERERG